MSAPKLLKTLPVSRVEALGTEFLAVGVFPMVGDRDYLHVALVSSKFDEAYTGYTKGATFTEGLTKFSTERQVVEKLDSGYSTTKLLKEACGLGRIGIIRELYPRVEKWYPGMVEKKRLCADMFISMAKQGRLCTMKWAVDSGTLSSDALTFGVQNAAVKAGHLDIFRYCVEKQKRYGYADVEDSIAAGLDDKEYMQWAESTFSRLLIARGAAGSSSGKALELFKSADPIDAGDFNGQYMHFQRAFQGGNIAVLTHVAGMLRVANSYDTSTDWVERACVWVRSVDNLHRSDQTHTWYNERSMAWATAHFL